VSNASGSKLNLISSPNRPSFIGGRYTGINRSPYYLLWMARRM
jgi:hypothetical protein